jgi:hypothetical protein
MPSKTVDPSTYATNQAVLRVSRRSYVRYRSPRRLLQCFYYAASFLPLRLSFLRPLDGGYEWRRFYERFIYGDINPAIVVDASAGFVASYTDLDSTLENRFPVIKVFREKLSLVSRPVHDGETFAAVSVYRRNADSEVTGRWSDFSPIVADCVVTDPNSCAFAKAKIPPPHWTALRLGVSQLSVPIAPGLYDVHLPESVRTALLSV